MPVGPASGLTLRVQQCQPATRGSRVWGLAGGMAGWAALCQTDGHLGLCAARAVFDLFPCDSFFSLLMIITTSFTSFAPSSARVPVWADRRACLNPHSTSGVHHAGMDLRQYFPLVPDCVQQLHSASTLFRTPPVLIGALELTPCCGSTHTLRVWLAQSMYVAQLRCACATLAHLQMSAGLFMRRLSRATLRRLSLLLCRL